MQVIGGQSEDNGKLRDTSPVSVAFNAEVDGGLITIPTSPSSGTELGDELCVAILIHTKYVKNSKHLSLGDDLIEHMITFLLHIGPINIQLWSDGILPILDDREVPI
jgi:hypothetical protein